MVKKLINKIFYFLKHQSEINKAENFFVLICLFFGSFFVITTPALWGIDEIEHFFRAYQISNFDLGVYKIDDDNYGGKIPHEVSRLGQYAKGDLVDNVEASKMWNKNDYNYSLPYDELKDHSISGELEDVIFSNTAAYSPIGYIPSATGVGIARILNLSIGETITLSRFSNLLAYTTIVFFAIRLVRRKEAWLIFVIALLPMMVFQASIVSNDTIINGVALLLFATLLRIYDLYKTDRKIDNFTASIVGISLSAIALSKPNYVFLLLIFLLLPAKLFNDKSTHLKLKLIWTALAVCPVIVWALVSSPVSEAISMFRGSDIAKSINVEDQIMLVITHPFTFLVAILRTLVMYGNIMTQNVIGILGWNYIGMPILSVICAYFLLVVAALNTKSVEFQTSIISVIGSILLVVFSIFFVLYATFNPVGETYILGVQGRYFLPLLPFVLYVISRILPIKVAIKKEHTAPLFLISSVVLLIIAASYYFISTY